MLYTGKECFSDLLKNDCLQRVIKMAEGHRSRGIVSHKLYHLLKRAEAIPPPPRNSELRGFQIGKHAFQPGQFGLGVRLASWRLTRSRHLYQRYFKGAECAVQLEFRFGYLNSYVLNWELEVAITPYYPLPLSISENTILLTPIDSRYLNETLVLG